MARTFDDGNPDYLALGSTPVTADPLTMACWFNTDDTGTFQTIMSVTDNDGDTDYIMMAMNSGGPELRLAVRNGGLDTVDTGTVVQGTWHHGAVTLDADGNGNVYLDGVAGSEQASMGVPSGVDDFGIGALVNDTVQFPFSGSIRWPSSWNVELPAWQVQMLAGGAHPYRVSRESLVAFAECHQDEDWETISSTALTVTGTPTIGVDPQGLVMPAHHFRGAI